jgi:hypothetical protein
LFSNPINNLRDFNPSGANPQDRLQFARWWASCALNGDRLRRPGATMPANCGRQAL